MVSSHVGETDGPGFPRWFFLFPYKEATETRYDRPFYYIVPVGNNAGNYWLDNGKKRAGARKNVCRAYRIGNSFHGGAGATMLHLMVCADLVS